MPALPSVPKVLQLAIQTELSDDNYKAINRVHFAYTGTAPSPAQLDSFATTVLTAFASALVPSMGNNKSITMVNAIDLSSPTAAVGEASGANIGTLAGLPLSDDDAMVMSATVARRYRGGHPRSYLLVGDSTKLDTGHTWDSTFLAAVQTAWAGFITAVEGAGWAGAGTLSPVNVSYYEGFTNLTSPAGRNYNVPKLRVGGPVVDAITTYVARALLGTQRRRLAR